MTDCVVLKATVTVNVCLDSLRWLWHYANDLAGITIKLPRCCPQGTGNLFESIHYIYIHKQT